MKKLLLTAVVALVTLSANAQVYAGGSVAFWRNFNGSENVTTFSLKPEVGYNLSDNLAIGVALGYEYEYYQGGKWNGLSVNPYARYTFAEFGPVKLFADGGFEFETGKWKDADSESYWGVGVKPGVAVNLTEQLSFVAHLGFVGYRDSNDHAYKGGDGIGFDLSGNDLSFGLYYNF